MAKEWIAVALGGMLGSLARHTLSWGFSLLGTSWLPIATLIANILGCFAIGALAQWSLQQELSKEWWIVGIRVGLLGGLTTFSSFGLDVVRMWNEHRNVQSIGLASAHILVGLLAVAVGLTWMKSTTAD